MRLTLLAVPCLVLAACDPEIPDSAAGVGFEDGYPSYLAQREAELTGVAGNDAAAAEPVLDENGNPVPDQTVVTTNNPGISDEQSFAAVSERESIQSDAARIEAQREVYEFIEPTAVPERVDDGAPNIVTYALQSTNAVGESVYRRSGNTTAEGLARNCARYGSSDLAQEAFLASGGPERDPKRLDPDGDGFACYWDPTPFRNIAAN
ncbi:hypothetical protein [Rhodovulum sp. FJ3]|uniref:hypothetical protein n=1 Tax=Rhodovulum sp. FJ3 TaxID=3079053 RepID=UPI00293DC20D|nr:hypothetical protein [Rhodovulum sp. FJ3]MDV4168420.1 hypothetical protein [Rhodovulum sp. FJ3]